MEESTNQYSKPIINSVDTKELRAIYARKDVKVLHCKGEDIYRYMQNLIRNVRAGRISGELVYCQIKIGKDFNLGICQLRRLFIPFHDYSKSQWTIWETSGRYLDVEYVFKQKMDKIIIT